MNKNHEWLKRSRTFLYDAYWPPFTPELKYTAEDGIAIAKRMNANVIRFGSIGKWALYQSKIMPRHPDLKGRDLLGETVELAHRSGIKVIAYIPVSHALPTEIVWKIKPEWAFVGDGEKNVEPVKHFGGLEIVPCCINGKYHNDILDIVREVVGNYDADGIYLDGPYQGWAHHNTVCQCDSCRRIFFSDTGIELPTNSSMKGNPLSSCKAGNKYLTWINAKLAGILSEIRDIVKSGKDLPLLINRTSMKITGLDNEPAMIKFVDGFLTETDAGGIEGFSYGAIHDKIVWNYTTQHRHWPRLSSIRLEKESALEAYRTISMCATPIVAYAGRYFYENQNSHYMKSAFSKIKALEKFLRGSSSEKFAAVLFPGGKAQATVDFHALMKINPDAYELYKCLHDGGIQTMVLPDYILDDNKLSSSFKIICLPSSLQINAKRAAQLKEFVGKGGILLVSGSRNSGFRKRESKIESLLGVEILKEGSEAGKLLQDLRWNGKSYEFYIRASDKNSGFKHGKALMPQCDFIPIKPKTGTRVAAETVCWPKGEKEFPSTVINKTGKGETVYFNSPIEDLLSEYGQIEFREFLNGTLKNSVGWNLPFEVESHTPLSVSIAEKEGMKLLHVLNEMNFGADTRFSAMIRIPENGRFLSAGDGRKELKAEIRENEVTIKNLSVSEYECLIIRHSDGGSI